jgi:hypothetical protein
MKYNRQTPCVYKNLRVVFHGIPKNASTSIKNALYTYEHGAEFISTKQYIHKGNEKGGSIYPDIECIKTKFDDWFHFTVVRNPIHRFISFYSDLFAGATNTRNSTPKFYLNNRIKLKPTPIDQVIDMIEQFEDNVADEHFASQSSFIHVENCHTIKVEDLDAGWTKVCNEIRVDYQPLPVYNKSTNTTFLTEEQISRIYKRYKTDFEQFGYTI